MVILNNSKNQIFNNCIIEEKGRDFSESPCSIVTLLYEVPTIRLTHISCII